MSKATTPKKAAKKATPKSADPDKDICFVIMPFGYPFDDYYRDVFIPAIEEAGLTPRRADDLFRTSAIINDIWELTKKAKILLADVSTKKPNVFYELGLAHAIAKPVVIISQTMDDVPFDLRSLRIKLYDKNKSNWGEILRWNIKQALIETVESPVGSVLPTFLNASTLRQEIKISEKDFLILKNDVESLKNSLANPQQPMDKEQSRTQSASALVSSKGYNDEILENIILAYCVDDHISSNMLRENGIPNMERLTDFILKNKIFQIHSSKIQKEMLAIVPNVIENLRGGIIQFYLDRTPQTNPS